MNEKNIIKKCIKFKKLKKIPWQINYTINMAEKLLKALNINRFSHKVLDREIMPYKNLDDLFGNHIAGIRCRGINSDNEVSKGIWKDEWGVLWDRRMDRDIGVPINNVLNNLDLGKIKIPDPDNPDRLAHFDPLINLNSNRYIIVKFGLSLFERAWALRGMEKLLFDFAQNPCFVKELLNIITEFNLKILKNIKEYKVDGVFFSDDWGYQNGLLMSPGMWKEFIRPFFKKMCAQSHRLGYDVFVHSCGNIALVINDLVDIGVNVLNPLQPEVFDLKEIIKKYHEKINFYGGISTQRTLPFSDKKGVMYEVTNTIILAKKYGGFIISPSHDLPADVPIENVMTMMDVLKSQ